MLTSCLADVCLLACQATPSSGCVWGQRIRSRVWPCPHRCASTQAAPPAACIMHHFLPRQAQTLSAPARRCARFAGSHEPHTWACRWTGLAGPASPPFHSDMGGVLDAWLAVPTGLGGSEFDSHLDSSAVAAPIPPAAAATAALAPSTVPAPAAGAAGLGGRGGCCMGARGGC